MPPDVSAETPGAIAYSVTGVWLAALDLWAYRNKIPYAQVKAKR